MATHMRWMIGVYRWQVSEGRFFVHPHSGHLLPLNAQLCAMNSVLVSRVDWWRTFLTNCEEIHNCSSKWIRGNHIAKNWVLAMIRGFEAIIDSNCLSAGV